MANGGGIDWGSIISAIGGAGAQYGLDRTKKYQDIRQQESYYDSISDANAGYLAKLKELYAPELSGELRPSELAAREKLVGKAGATTGANQATLAQTLQRLGVTGGKVAGQAAQSNEQQLADYIANLDAELVAGADARRTGALGQIAQVEGQANMQQAPIQAQIDAMKQGLGDYKMEDLQQYLLAPALSALLGGGVNRFGGNVDTGALVKQASLNPLLERFGMNTGMLSQQDGTFIENGNVYKRTSDQFGNPSKEYVGPAKTRQGESTYNLKTGQYENIAGNKPTPATSYANQIAQIMRNKNLSDKEKDRQIEYIRQVAGSQGVVIPAPKQKDSLMDWIGQQVDAVKGKTSPEVTAVSRTQDNKVKLSDGSIITREEAKKRKLI